LRPERGRHCDQVPAASIFLHVLNRIVVRAAPSGLAGTVGQIKSIDRAPVAPNQDNRTDLTNFRLQC
jgi:hypothetical protein